MSQVTVIFDRYTGGKTRRQFCDLRSALHWAWPRSRIKFVCNIISDAVDQLAG